MLKGDDLVGPRPIIKAEINRYERILNDYYLVLPGITGMWQVSGRSDTTYEERVAMDSWYVRNWSLWLDVILLIRTRDNSMSSRRGILIYRFCRWVSVYESSDYL